MNQLNQEYENLKSRKFMARRGRNNRIFYKPMEKAIFGYDSNEDNTKETKKNNKKHSKNQNSYEVKSQYPNYLDQQM